MGDKVLRHDVGGGAGGVGWEDPVALFHRSVILEKDEEEVVLVAIAEFNVSSTVVIVSLDLSVSVSGISVSGGGCGGGGGDDKLPRFNLGGGNEYIGRTVPALCLNFCPTGWECSIAGDFSSSSSFFPTDFPGIMVWLDLVCPGVGLVMLAIGVGEARCVFQVGGTGETDFCGGDGVRRVAGSDDASAIHLGLETAMAGLFRTVVGTTGENCVGEEDLVVVRCHRWWIGCCGWLDRSDVDVMDSSSTGGLAGRPGDAIPGKDAAVEGSELFPVGCTRFFQMSTTLFRLEAGGVGVASTMGEVASSMLFVSTLIFSHICATLFVRCLC